MTLMEQQLTENEWLVAGKPTIVDIACYPYVLAPAGESALRIIPYVR